MFRAINVFLMSTGKLFHAWGPATEYACEPIRVPRNIKRITGITNTSSKHEIYLLTDLLDSTIGSRDATGIPGIRNSDRILGIRNNPMKNWIRNIDIQCVDRYELLRKSFRKLSVHSMKFAFYLVVILPNQKPDPESESGSESVIRVKSWIR